MSEAEELEVGPESAPESIESETPEEAKEPEGYIKAEEAQRQINKQHKKYRDEERARLKLEAEAERLKGELHELKAQQVVVPPIPDPYSDNYEAEVQARDEAIKRKTELEAAETRLEDQARQNKEAAKAKEQESLEQKVAGFDSRMVDLGLNPVAVKKAVDTLIDYGASDTLQDIMLDDDEGPLLVQYLADNPLELEALNGMSALQMVKTIDGDIRRKAALLKPKTSRAPDPPETLTGGGVKELEDPLLAGVRFE